MPQVEGSEVQRNRYYSPRSTAWASEDERSHAGLRCIKRPPQKVFETRCRGAILHASLAENVLSGDKNRRYVSRNMTVGRTLLSSPYVCPGRNRWKKASSRKLLAYRQYLSTTGFVFGEMGWRGKARWRSRSEVIAGAAPIMVNMLRAAKPSRFLLRSPMGAACSLSLHRAAAK